MKGSIVDVTRLIDLVRHQRHALHTEGLISDEEYAALLTEHPRSVERLETYDELRSALEESVKLQSHYAKLLNMHDGGERVPFENADAWIARLRDLRRQKPQSPPAKPPDGGAQAK